MPLSKSRWCGRSALCLCIGIASTLLMGCATSTPSSPAKKDLLLVLLACPQATPLSDGSFGATTEKLAWYAVTYRKCREAALAEAKTALQEQEKP